MQMLKFVIGFILGSFLAGAGVLVITGDHIVSGGKVTLDATKATLSIVENHVDDETYAKIKADMNKMALQKVDSSN